MPGISLSLTRFLQVLASVATLGLALFLAGRITSNRTVLIAVAIFGILSPAWCAYPPRILSETLFGFLFVGSLALLVYGITSTNKSTVRWFALSGLLLGLAALTRPVVLLLPILLAVVTIVLRSKKFQDRHVILLVLTFSCAVAPWTLRNALVFDAFIPVTTTGGVVMWEGLHPDPRGFGYNPWNEISRAAGTHDAVQRDKVLKRKAIREMFENPLHALRMAVIKLIWFFNPWEGDSYTLGSPFNPHTFLVLVLCALGVGSRFLRRGNLEEDDGKRVAVTILAVVFVYFVLMAVVFYGSPRFRMPVEPLLWIGAGCGLSVWAKWPRAVREIAAVAVLAVIGGLYLGGDSVKGVLVDFFDAAVGYHTIFPGSS